MGPMDIWVMGWPDLTWGTTGDEDFDWISELGDCSPDSGFLLMTEFYMCTDGPKRFENTSEVQVIRASLAFILRKKLSRPYNWLWWEDNSHMGHTWQTPSLETSTVCSKPTLISDITELVSWLFFNASPPLWLIHRGDWSPLEPFPSQRDRANLPLLLSSIRSLFQVSIFFSPQIHANIPRSLGSTSSYLQLGVLPRYLGAWGFSMPGRIWVGLQGVTCVQWAGLAPGY